MTRGKECFLLVVLLSLCFRLGFSKVGLLKGEKGPVVIEDVVVSPNTCKEFHSLCGVTLFEVDFVQKGCQHATNLRTCLKNFGCRLKELEMWDEYVDKICTGGVKNGAWTLLPSVGILVLAMVIAILLA